MTERSTTPSAPTPTVPPGESGTPTSGTRMSSGSPPRQRECRPGEAASENSVGDEFRSSVPKTAEFRTGADGFQRVAADGPIALEDRHAAWQAGYLQGVIDGRAAEVVDDRAVLAEVLDALAWIRHRASLAAEGGPAFAEWASAERPTIDGDRRE